MKVFKLKPDHSYLSFYTWNPDAGNTTDLYSSALLGIGGARRASSWDPVRLYPERSGLPRGHFMYLWSCNFAIDEFALDVLKPLLESCCEFLPLAPYEGQVFHLLNVLDCVDCLDRQATTWVPPATDSLTLRVTENYNPISIDEYSFDTRRLPTSALFRIPEERNVGELTVAGILPCEQEFKSIVERAGLTGLKFEEIWSEDGFSIRRKQRMKAALGF